VPPRDAPLPTLAEFFELDWVKDPTARVELLFLRRDKPTPSVAGAPAGAGEAHVAFPGGRTEDGDEGGLYTAMRQTWEEIGIDLAEREYVCIGQLDDREITTSLGKRLLMILSPFGGLCRPCFLDCLLTLMHLVFLQLSSSAPAPEPVPSTTLHWVPLSALVGKIAWSRVTVDAASRLAPRHARALRLLVRVLVGKMQFPAIALDPAAGGAAADEKRAARIAGDTERVGPRVLKLWGLSLGMTLDLVTAMVGPGPLALPDELGLGLGADVVGSGAPLPPSLTSVFPRFSYEVNFWIWVFGCAPAFFRLPAHVR
jgi:8-oxo-dGTP pyrophosphatase MutT (NUDIX family)